MKNLRISVVLLLSLILFTYAPKANAAFVTEEQARLVNVNPLNIYKCITEYVQQHGFMRNTLIICSDFISASKTYELLVLLYFYYTLINLWGFTLLRYHDNSSGSSLFHCRFLLERSKM
jgi:hypothetical protein